MWTIEALDQRVVKELAALPADMRAKLRHVAELVERFGLPHVGLPYVRHLEAEIWEFRLRGRDGIARALFVIITGRRAVIVRVFRKKTQKTPRREIALARQRAQELQ